LASLGAAGGGVVVVGVLGVLVVFLRPSTLPPHPKPG
jgi:hypothetical protein